ncbi:MAG: fumarylacetoacetate hydrolase family protein [Pseudomonadota bacterium]
MQLATIAVDGKAVAAVRLKNGAMLEIAKAANGASPDSLKAGTIQALIEAGPEGLGPLQSLVAEAEAGQHDDACHMVPESAVMAPLPKPLKNVFCVGRNYADHIAEGERAQKKTIGITDHPVYFTKPPTSVVGPGGVIPIFRGVSENIDYEVELAVVIGKPGRNIPKEDAFDHVFGYTILNDITARDVQRRHGGQYFKGKALDGSCPLGPWIVTADEISDPHDLAIRLSVNDEMRQDGTTRDMIFDIPTLISSLSEGLTLEPGDIVATGTPSGVGYAMEPPQFLKDGDTVTCEIAQIGELKNTVRLA